MKKVYVVATIDALAGLTLSNGFTLITNAHTVARLCGGIVKEVQLAEDIEPMPTTAFGYPTGA